MRLHPVCYSLLISLIAGSPAFCQIAATDIATASPSVRAAVQQINLKDLASAQQTLTQGINANQNDVAARRYLAYVLLERNQPKQALEQLQLLPMLGAFDLFVKGSALLATSQPFDAVVCLCEAVRMEPLNDTFRDKAVGALVQVSDYSRAGALCAEGQRLAKDPSRKKRYEEQFQRFLKLAALLEKAKNCPLRNKGTKKYK